MEHISPGRLNGNHHALKSEGVQVHACALTRKPHGADFE